MENEKAAEMSFFKKFFILYPAVYLAKFILWILLATCRIEVNGLDRFINRANRDRCILMLWHNRLLILPGLLRRYAPQFIYRAVISKSRDGEALEILAHSYSAGRTLRVAHNAKDRALNQIIRQLREGQEIVIITPDGPRGPKYQIKPGIILAARASSAYVVPLTWVSSHVWQLNTWDNLMIPKPFSTIKLTFGEPIHFSKEIERTNEEDKAMLQQALEDI